MKTKPLLFPICLLLSFTGCAKETPAPRFTGTVVSHVDSYGSGTGSNSQLSNSGGMHTGFDYADDSKQDWSAEIKWTFLHREGNSDIYHLEWNYSPESGTIQSESKTLAYDGENPVQVAINKRLFISIEPEKKPEESKTISDS